MTALLWSALMANVLERACNRCWKQLLWLVLVVLADCWLMRLLFCGCGWWRAVSALVTWYLWVTQLVRAPLRIPLQAMPVAAGGSNRLTGE